MKSNCFLFISVLSIIFYCTCCSQKSEYVERDIKPNNSIGCVVNENADSIYLNSVRGMEESNNYYFVTDYKNNIALKLDSNMIVRCKIGKYGSGPGEFRGAAGICVKNDSIYVVDDGNKRINVYDVDGNYKRAILLPATGSIRTRFAVDNDYNIYLSSARKDHPIIKLDNNGGIVKEFGEIYTFTGRKNMQRNLRHILLHGNRIIAVMNTEAIIEVYDLDGRMIKKYDYREKGIFRDQIQEQEELYKKENYSEGFSVEIFADAYISKNTLVVLFWSPRDEQENTFANKLLICDIANDDIIPKEVLNLHVSTGDSEGSNGSIVLKNSELLTFQRNISKLKKYEMLKK